MAGGFGTRLRPLTINLPKPMVPIGNLPMMEHVVSLLKQAGITEITSVLYFQPEHITGYFKDGSAFGVKMSYIRPDDDLGTAGAVRYATKGSTEPVLVISGDVVTTFDLVSAIEWHRKKQAAATILLTRAENPLAYGIVITEESGRIVRFLEKPTWGEAFSDTINTGIYVLEPSALDLIPEEQNYDFSQQLFPQMLQRDMPLYGRIMDGYWKDVGNVGEYQLAHQDLLRGDLKLSFPFREEQQGNARIFFGKDVRLSPEAKLSGTIILGDGVVVESDAVLSHCAIGDRVWVGRGAEIRHSTIWADSFVGNNAIIDNAIVCHRVRLGDHVQLMDQAIVSDDCVIGSGAMIRTDCKIWPNKSVDEGAIVTRSMVWGEKWTRELFTDSKVTGLAMTELTPEMTVRLGSAFGSTLGPNAIVITSRDASDVSRLLRRGLISGLLAAGVDVVDLETMPVPVVRYALSRGGYNAAVYARHNPDDFRQIDFIFMDGSGLDMPTGKLKKVERNYFGEDYDLASMDRIGHLTTQTRLLDDYRSAFLSQIDADLVRKADFRVVIDHGNGASSQVFPTLFSGLGIEAVELNATLNPRRFSRSSEEQAQSITQLGTIVRSLGSHAGFMLNPAAEKLTVVDDTGSPIDNQELLLIVTHLYLQTHNVKKIAVTVGASMGVEEIAQNFGVEVFRVPNDHRSMMEARLRGGAEFVAGTRGGFIFPGLQLGADAIIATMRIIELLARTGSSLSQLRNQLDPFSREMTSVPCPWTKRGQVMRRLITDSSEKERQLIDGVRIFEDEGWVLVMPDRHRAMFNILAESRSPDLTHSLVRRYSRLVEESQESVA